MGIFPIKKDRFGSLKKVQTKGFFLPLGTNSCFFDFISNIIISDVDKYGQKACSKGVL